MNRGFIHTFCALLGLLAVGCGNNATSETDCANYLEAKNITHDVTIDGKADEWNISEPILDGLLAPWNGRVVDETKIHICHDAENLYFLYTVEDETPICDDEPSETQSCPTLCDPMNRSTPGLPVHHQLPEFTQTHVHRVSDAIQPSHPLSSPSPPAPNPSQHQSLFQ